MMSYPSGCFLLFAAALSLPVANAFQEMVYPPAIAKADLPVLVSPPLQDTEPMPWTLNTKVYGEFDQDDLTWAWTTVHPEATAQYVCEDVEGVIPPDISGTFYKNGPANFERDGNRYNHVLDGDGFVTSFRFDNGKVTYTGRFVETEEFLREQKADKVLFRSVFGTQRKGGMLGNAFDLKLKNPANTNILEWGGRLLALWEAGAPVELDRTTMRAKTSEDIYKLAPFNLLGPAYCNLRGITFDQGGPIDHCLGTGRSFTAHPHVLDDNTLIGFSSAAIADTNDLSMQFVEYDRHWKLKQDPVEYKFQGMGPPHDFSISDDYYGFFQNQFGMNRLEYIVGLKSPTQAMKLLLKKPSVLHMVPRTVDSKAVPIQVEVPNYFNVHNVGEAQQEGNRLLLYSNGWDLADERFFSKSANAAPFKFPWGGEHPDFSKGEVPPPHFFRTVVDVTTGELLSHEEVIPGLVMEFPTQAIATPKTMTSQQQQQVVYAGASGTGDDSLPLVGLCKINLEDDSAEYWWAGHRIFTGEPLPSQKQTGIGHWILTLLYDAAKERTSLAILDSESFTEGPVALVHLRQQLSLGLHSFFSPSSGTLLH